MTHQSTSEFQAPALREDLPALVAEYNAKLASIPEELAAFKAAIDSLTFAGCFRGGYVGPIVSSTDAPSQRTMESNLLESAWQHIYKRYRINEIASASDRKQFDLSMKTPPEFTEDTILATFGPYVAQSRFHILKGLAECFTNLDDAYKSHSKVRVGVKGLPKRIIISNVGSWGSWGYERLRDTLNALRVYQGRPHITHMEYEDFLNLADKSIDDLPEWEPNNRYSNRSIVQHEGKMYRADNSMYGRMEFIEGSNNWLRIYRTEPELSLKRFKNGHGHLIFAPEMLKTINRALSEFYGEVLPDTPDEKPEKQESTEVSKDLQFFPTPDAVMQRVLADMHFPEDCKVLEPSCGDGRFAMAIVEKAKNPIRMATIEVDPARAALASAKGFRPLCGNFLEQAPSATFDRVVMNPPFYGLHYLKHLKHALRFLNEDGQLACILPASAWYDHGGIPDACKGRYYRWHDLPTASFNESGTNIPTGYLTVY